MESENSRTYEETRTAIEGYAKSAFANHIITEIGPNEWYASQPGHSEYHFFVICRPYAVMIYGDLGEWVLRISDRNARGWLRRAADSPSYLMEKIQASKENKECWYWKDAQSEMERRRDEWDEESEGEFEANPYALALEEADYHSDELSQERFMSILHDQDEIDPEEYYIGESPSSGTLWLIEIAKWFDANVENAGTRKSKAILEAEIRTVETILDEAKLNLTVGQYSLEERLAALKAELP